MPGDRTSTPNKGTIPFFVVLGSLFLGLIIGVSGTLSWYHYQRTSRLILDETQNQYRKTARIITGAISERLNSVRQVVTLLTASHHSFPVTGKGWQALLPQFATALKITPHVTGLQIGFPNGDYFMVRPLNNPEQRARFQAPPGAVYGVDLVTATAGKSQLVRVYFDGQLKEISRNPPVSTTYDPRVRPWYKQALHSREVTVSPIYLFFFTRKVGTTISLKHPQSGAVIAADITLQNLSAELARYQPTESSELLIFNSKQQVLAYQRPEMVVRKQGPDSFRLTTIDELNTPPLAALSDQRLFRPGPLLFAVQGQEWIGAIDPIRISDQHRVYLLVTSPKSELLAGINAIRHRSLLLTLGIILLSIPLALAVALSISRKLHGLARKAAAISEFNFSGTLRSRSTIREITELTAAMETLRSTLSRFLNLIRMLAGEQNFTSLLHTITRETAAISRADGVLLLLTDNDDGELSLASQCAGTAEHDEHDLGQFKNWSCLPGLTDRPDTGRSHLERLDRTEADTAACLFDWLRTDRLALLVLPLNNRQEKTIGLLVLLYADPGPEDPRLNEYHISFLEQFSGFAAVSLESKSLLQSQKQLLESFIELLAGAIDAKSAYTGGHCQRVPVIAEMLARAACEDNSGPFRDFQLSESQWEELHIAAWLHDCGKVTTPEYVVDKATKLETITDRIHEIRTRFEVLKRDAHVRFYQRLLEGEDEEKLKQELEEEWQRLDHDFAFVARCNTGEEWLSPEDKQRLQTIGARTWLRTLDDRIGISWEERQRKAAQPAPTLPVAEPLLADRPDHMIPRPPGQTLGPDNPWGFRLDVPKLLYNRGELYNLMVERGTLTPEERFKINDHIVQTIIMLEHLPFPDHLKQVPAIAGGHHETMIGTGYPRKLTGDQLSLTARVMVIADIFEALTAADRPYKKAKTLSESLRILAFMARDGHIDPDLFRLLLRSGVVHRYARDYLSPEQLDDVATEELLALLETG